MATSYDQNTKNSSSYSEGTKNLSTFVAFLRHNSDPKMSELADYTFQSVVFPDGTTFESITFEQLAAIVYTQNTKN